MGQQLFLTPDRPHLALNKWREAQFRDSFENYLTVEQWLLEKDEEARLLLTADIRAELAAYREDELTGRRIVVVARKQ